MKKRMLSAAVILIIGFGAATTLFATKSMQAIVITQEQEEVTYAEIKTSELPETVSAALQQPAYSDYTVSKAFKGSDGTYKVLLSNEDKQNINVIFSADGELKKVEETENSNAQKS